MADLRIVDAPLLSTVKGTEKIPTGGEGNFSVSIDQVADFAKLKWFLATEGYVDNAVGNVQADLNLHKNNSSNPHSVTKEQVGLSNVDNTADLDKPVSNATQSAIITANSGKADKLDLKASKIESDSGQTQQVINDFGGAKWYAKSGGYELGATVKLENGDKVKSTVANNIIDPNVDMTGWVIPESPSINQLYPKKYGAVGDGVSDDTNAFKLVELDEQKQVDLQGYIYAIKSVWADSVNGVTLTKDYVNGTLLVDGKDLVFNKNENFATSAASSARLGQASTIKSVGIKRVNGNEYHVWRPLGGQFWQQAILRRTTGGVPLNWQDTYIKQVLGYICCEDGLTYSGTWATLDATTGISSSDPNTYVGGRVRQATTAGDYVDIPYTGGGGYLCCLCRSDYGQLC